MTESRWGSNFDIIICTSQFLNLHSVEISDRQDHSCTGIYFSLKVEQLHLFITKTCGDLMECNLHVLNGTTSLWNHSEAPYSI